MSEQEKINFGNRILDNILETQRKLFERKAKLGESVIVADNSGKPITITAEEALRRLNATKS